MARRTILRQRAWGEMILSRLAERRLPPELTRHVRAFRAAQANLVAATRKAKTARARRDTALAALARADGALERALVTLGKRLIATGLGTKKSPFGPKAMTPTQMAALDHARELVVVHRLVGKLRGTRTEGRTNAVVTKAISACVVAATSLETARGKVALAQQAYARALDARDALLGKWTTALVRLERRAYEVLSDEIDFLARVFAPLDEDEPLTVLDLRPALPNLMNGVHT